ncbi:LOG family protein [Nostoc flagelliforme]|uniref:LOG family protein n=1 Tax=Nostoc flagelliforme TaxID=1306274 RepID=UPI001ABF8AE0
MESFYFLPCLRHQKPCGLLNVERYFDPLLRLFDHAVKEQFLKSALRSLVLEASDA